MKLIDSFVKDEVKKSLADITAEQADLGRNGMRNSFSRALPASAIVEWQDQIKNQNKKFFPETIQENIKIMEAYIRLCLENGAKPIAVTFPFAPVIHDNYDETMLGNFRKILSLLEQNYDFKFIDLFDLPLDYTCFYNLSNLNLKGSYLSSLSLANKLCEEKILSLDETLCKIDYARIELLSHILPKDEYNEFLDKIFEVSEAKIRRKDKVKIGFVVRGAAEWCGDELYNFFAQDERFETTVFNYWAADRMHSKLCEDDFWIGVEQFKKRGLNLVALDNVNAPVPKQDVLIFLSPYIHAMPKAFWLNNLTAETLTAHIYYGFDTSGLDAWYWPIFRILWRDFFETTLRLERWKQNSTRGMTCGYYSGYPRLDVLKNNLTYEWKMARPNAKKIIYAPHWTIDGGLGYSTFRWNHEFMYEFAKNHPETSWVVKPHPNLFFQAVDSGLFPTAEAFEEYLKKWDDLPNAQVYTGAYYHEIFATSDGMILDSSSFIAEYQYTHKPLIFLTRDTQKFNDLGKELMAVSYRVDGKDLDGIAEMMQRIFIEGKDELFEERKKFFDKYLNYEKINGMSASEFIFKNISQALR